MLNYKEDTMKETYKHFIRTDAQNRVIKSFSTAFEQPLPSDILINTEGGRHFEIDDEVNPSLYNEKWIPLFKYEAGKIVKRTDQEIQVDIDALPPAPPTLVESLQAETAELWYQNMVLEGRLSDETSAIWYEIMTGGGTA